MSTEVRETALAGVHRALGAKMTPFGGWSMPLAYGQIRAEHAAARTAAGLFDLCHMGRIAITGPGRIRLIEYVATNRYADVAPGGARYALLCNDQGGCLDDIIAYVLNDHVLVVVNAANRAQDLAWIEYHAKEQGCDVGVEDRSDTLAMLAVQGPTSPAILEPLTETTIANLPYYSICEATLLGHPMWIARTGYTGEDGFELYFEVGQAQEVWHGLLSAGQSHGLVPVGLGARDTLRLEAAMPLYGHEITATINPFEAGLGFGVKLDREPFMGQRALVEAKANRKRKLVCITCDSKRIPRHGQTVRVGDQEVGVVTSGTFSPTLNQPICMALLASDHAAIGTPLTIDVRNNSVAAQIVKRPFYKRAKA